MINEERDALKRRIGWLERQLEDLMDKARSNAAWIWGMPAGSDPRSELPEDVQELQKALDASKRAYATAKAEKDEIDKAAFRSVSQLETKLAVALDLLSLKAKKTYMRKIGEMGWSDPISFEEDVL